MTCSKRLALLATALLLVAAMPTACAAPGGRPAPTLAPVTGGPCLGRLEEVAAGPFACPASFDGLPETLPDRDCATNPEWVYILSVARCGSLIRLYRSSDSTCGVSRTCFFDGKSHQLVGAEETFGGLVGWCNGSRSRQAGRVAGGCETTFERRCPPGWCLK